jgi:hypothetical protein
MGIRPHVGTSKVVTYGHLHAHSPHYGFDEQSIRREAPWAQKYAGRAQGDVLSSKSVADGDGLQLEVAATQQGSRADEFTSRQFLGCEIGAVGRIEFVVEAQIGAGNLNVD